MRFYIQFLKRSVAAIFGLIAVYLLLSQSGFHNIETTLLGAAPIFPIVLFLEAAILACTMNALRILYLEDGKKIPLSALARAGLVGYSVMGLIPAGRTVAETTRAAMLSKYSNGARAMVAAARMQATVLFGIAAISVPVALVFFWLTGLSLPTILVIANFFLTFMLGLGILLVGRKSKIGSFLSRRFPFLKKPGAEFDQNFSNQKIISLRSLFWEFLGRIIQVVQNGFLVLAVGGKFGIMSAFVSEGVHLIGASAGDLIPAQLGATELSYHLSSQFLNLSATHALTIALLAHLAQIFWVSVGLLVQLFCPTPIPTLMPEGVA